MFFIWLIFYFIFLVSKRLRRLLPLCLSAFIDHVFSLDITVPLGEGSLC